MKQGGTILISRTFIANPQGPACNLKIFFSVNEKHQTLNNEGDRSDNYQCFIMMAEHFCLFQLYIHHLTITPISILIIFTYQSVTLQSKQEDYHTTILHPSSCRYCSIVSPEVPPFRHLFPLSHQNTVHCKLTLNHMTAVVLY